MANSTISAGLAYAATAGTGNSTISAAFVYVASYPAIRLIQWDLRIDWNMDGTYTDESAYLIAANGSMRLANPEDSITAGRGIVDSASVTLDNASGRFSPLNTASALTADIAGGGAYHVPMYLRVSVDGVPNYSRVFSGVLKIPAQIGATSKQHPTVTFDCRSWDEVILQQRVSTLQSVFVAIADGGYTEEEIIAQWLTDAGMTDGVEFTSQAHAGTATLDPGLWTIPWAWLDDESPITDIWQLAAACGGRFYADPDGVFRYENAAHWLYSPHTVSQATLTKDNFVTLSPWYDDGELYKAVEVEVSPRELLDASVIWKSEAVETIPANSTRTIVARMRQPAYGITTPVQGTDWIAITSGGANISANITISFPAPTKYAQRVSLAITNSHATQAANLVVLQLQGQAVDGQRRGSESKTSTDAFWVKGARTNWGRTGRTRSVTGNPYIQSTAQGAMLAEFLRDRMSLPRLTFKVSNVNGIPGRRLGDRLTLVDADVMTSSQDCFLTEINWTLGRNGFRQNYVGIDATSLYPYQTTYFVLGTSVLHLTASARVFY